MLSLVRLGIAAIVFASVALAESAADLDAIKKGFPSHTSGDVSEKSDPVTQRYYTKYREKTDRITSETLAKDVLWMRDSAHNDLRILEIMSDNYRKTYDAQTRAAARRNATWIRQKLMPYVARLTQYQRGR